MICAIHKSHECAELLIANGANVEYWTQADGSALHIAARNEDVRMCTLLVENGANPFIEDIKGWTPLDWVARKRDRKAWKIMEAFFKEAIGYGFLDFQTKEKGKNNYERYLCLLFYRDSYRDSHSKNPCELSTPLLTMFAFNTGDVVKVSHGAPKTAFGWVRRPAGFMQKKLNETIIQK